MRAVSDIGAAEPFRREGQRLARQADDMVLEQIIQNDFGELRRRRADRFQVDLGLFGRFVGRVDAGEVLDFARACALA